MLSFKDLEEVLQPKAAGEKRFKDKHVVDTIDYPLNDAEINKGTKKSPAKKKRIADSEEGKDAAVYEENITKCKCETCGCEVCECKMNEESLRATYGKSWKAVMYATATKQAMSESVDLDEALPPHLAKYIGKDGDFTPEVKKRLGKDFMKRMQVPSKKKSNVKDVTPKGYGPNEELDELSTKTLQSYSSKASDARDHRKLSTKKVDNRYAGVARASKKLDKKNEELDESAAGIAQLKKAYEPLRGKKISLDNAKKLSAIMDKFADDKAMLIKLVKADIPFVTQSAVTKLITKHNMKGAEINKMMKEGNAFGMALKAAKEKGDKTFVVAGVTYEVYESADLDEAPRRPKAPKMKMTDIMNRGKKSKTYQVDIDGSRATVTAASEKMAIQKAMTKLKINKKIKPLPKATVKVMEEVGLDEANPAKMSDDVLKSKLSQMEKSLKTRGDSPAIQFEIKRLKKEMKKRGIQEEVDLDEAFKINATNQKLNDGSMVKISKDDASALNGLYNSLNPANAKTMIKKMMQDKKSYGEILAFAKQAM